MKLVLLLIISYVFYRIFISWYRNRETKKIEGMADERYFELIEKLNTRINQKKRGELAIGNDNFKKQLRFIRNINDKYLFIKNYLDYSKNSYGKYELVKKWFWFLGNESFILNMFNPGGEEMAEMLTSRYKYEKQFKENVNNIKSQYEN